MDSTQSIIQSLAQNMGVSETDVMTMAQGIANDLVKDRVDDVYVNSDTTIQCDLVHAYSLHQQKKLREFHTTYLANPQAAKVFQSSVYDLVKQA